LAHLTVKEVAGRLAVSEATVYGLCSRRKLRHIRLGVKRGTIRIPEDSLNDFLAGVMVQPEEPNVPQAPPRKLTHLKV
jgi:excisionase family DNA binding protein